MTWHAGGRRRLAAIVIALALACVVPASALGSEWSTPRALSDRAWVITEPAAALGEDGYGVVSWSGARRTALRAMRPWLAARLPGDERLRKRRALGPRRSATIGLGMAEEEGVSFHVIWRPRGIGIRTHSADGTLGPLRRVAPARSEAVDLDVAPDGTAVFAWITRAGLRASIREPGGEFGPRVAILDDANAFFQVSAASGGAAAVAWQRFGIRPDDGRAFVTIRPPGGIAFDRPLGIPASARLDLNSAAINHEGAVAALFEEHTRSITVKAAVRPPGGLFPAPARIGIGAFDLFPLVEADTSGRFVSAWDRLTPNFGKFGPQVATHVEATGWSRPTPASPRGMGMWNLDVSPAGAIGIGIYDVQHRRIDLRASIAAAGEPMSIAERIHTVEQARELITPQVAVDDDGGAIAAWATSIFRPARVVASLRARGALSLHPRGGAGPGSHAGTLGREDALPARSAPALPPALERLLAPQRRP